MMLYGGMNSDERDPFWVKRVRIEGYKSIASCDVTLEPFTVLVGRNGAGKSNFLSALALLARVPTTDVRDLFGNRRGIDEVLCRRSPGGKFSVGVESEVHEPRTAKICNAFYEVTVTARRKSWSDRFEERLQLIEQGKGREVRYAVRE